MSLRSLIDQAIEKAGSQIKLAELMNVQQQVISAWRTGRRTCTTPHRIELCRIAGYDLKTALLEQVVEGLNSQDEIQAEAAKTLNALLAAFPKNGERISSHVSRIIIKILTKYRHLLTGSLTSNEPLGSGRMNAKLLCYSRIGVFPSSI